MYDQYRRLHRSQTLMTQMMMAFYFYEPKQLMEEQRFDSKHYDSLLLVSYGKRFIPSIAISNHSSLL
jgi:hypothetical protein